MKFLLLRVEKEIHDDTLGKLVVKQNKLIKYFVDYPPLGLLYIAAALEADGITVEIIDLSMEKISKKKLENSILSADAVGITFYTYSVEAVKIISTMIKEIDPNIPLIIGGFHCIFNQEYSLMDILSADVCVIGEGERSIINIVRVLQGKKKFSEVPGIFYREGTTIKMGKPIEIIDDLDSLKFPARHLVDKYKYKDPIFPYSKSLITSMITSRGCPFKCRFCGTRYLELINNYRYRERSVENVIKEIIEINDKFDSVLIADENFLSNIRRTHKILDKLIENKTELDLRILGARVNIAEINLYKKMKKAGVKYIGYGIESGSQKILDFYNKKITLNQAIKAVQLAHEMGFIVHGSFIFGAPIETKDDINKTIKFACNLPLDAISFSVLAYQKGSQLWIEANKKKAIRKDEYIVLADKERGLGNFTSAELTKYCIKAQMKFHLSPNRLIKKLFTIYKKQEFSFEEVKAGILNIKDSLNYPLTRKY